MPKNVGNLTLCSRIRRSSRLPVLTEVVFLILGVGLMILVSMLSFSIPGSQVPVSGQTFGVMLLALLGGWRVAGGSLLIYVLLGAWGYPVLAGGRSGLSLSSSGYLAGMIFSSILIGILADRGAASFFFNAFVLSVLGNLCVLTFGALGLYFFVAEASAFYGGFLPFLPGALLKSILSAGIATAVHSSFFLAKP